MRWRVFIIVSLALNVAFAAAWLISRNRSSGHLVVSVNADQASTNQVRTIPVYRKQFFSWREIESADYPTYIANLRDIGCPEDTIRDIVVADVNQLYARKKATEIVTSGQQWWRSEPDTNLIAAAVAKSRELDEEKQALLTRLLGPNWDNSEVVLAVPKLRANVALDGPVLGPLPEDVKEAVQEINARSRERTRAYMAAQRAQGKPLDPAELARLRQETRNELASVLPPAQLEEFLLRHSENADSLRKELGQLKYFNATSDEFRNLFRATDPIDQQLQALAGKDDPNSIEQRKSLERQREAAIKNALGPQRYAQYRRFQDGDYRDAYALGQQFNVSPRAIQALVEINRETAGEKARIAADTNLTAEQRTIALRQVELEQLKAQAEATGQELPPSATPPPPPEPPKRVYTIQAGDSVGAVSLQYGVGISAIRDANPDVDFSKLKPGDSIIIPRSLIKQ